ncbi:GntR family transcriptional regulator [Oceanobacillus profundus]|uniref:GntR family transcriptional regulator n=1 Tax=Oceanobacillus profundus TaxID=372463 RepID=A0A417YB90_9BACI|nr:GntR family transcriptional regulator [Oceanobacillus profundus]MBR3119643.1 GntR family transcriptional regulator [Oceanobacillus sp.]PAE30741.1 GntR family transcriptional regulator [Paenibacillus sp. 7884-2]MCM3398370.1 GntR family transcriptional regulator [Oceanobacillus profundus]MDO6451377.1 GntR family transcriptional regulator [Oceanobacillus profundus]RHW29831.1 GntR family transcriptional regulator [Oceanobacillus profundus]
MKRNFDEDKPIYIQVREQIEDQIINQQLKANDQAPSTNQLVHYYKINHATVSKGINQLVDEEILFKKRGIGMFVAEGARDKLLEKRRKSFMEDYIVTLVQEANKLEITTEDILTYIKKVKGSGK